MNIVYIFVLGLNSWNWQRLLYCVLKRNENMQLISLWKMTYLYRSGTLPYMDMNELAYLCSRKCNCLLTCDAIFVYLDFLWITLHDELLHVYNQPRTAVIYWNATHYFMHCGINSFPSFFMIVLLKYTLFFPCSDEQRIVSMRWNECLNYRYTCISIYMIDEDTESVTKQQWRTQIPIRQTYRRLQSVLIFMTLEGSNFHKDSKIR